MGKMGKWRTAEAIPVLPMGTRMVRLWAAASLVALVSLLAPLPARCSPLRLKVGTLAPDGTPWMDNLYGYLHGIEERSPQPLKFVTYPGGVMGDVPDLLRKPKLNQLEVNVVTVSRMANLVPETLVFALPPQALVVWDAYGRAVRQHFDEHGLPVVPPEPEATANKRR